MFRHRFAQFLDRLDRPLSSFAYLDHLGDVNEMILDPLATVGAGAALFISTIRSKAKPGLARAGPGSVPQGREGIAHRFNGG